MHQRVPAIAVSMICCLCITWGQNATAGDWPMFRYDAGRTASSPHELPAELHLQWTRKYSQRKQAWDDPLNQDLMKYDRVFEPVVSQGMLYIGFNDSDKVVALDVKTGAERWRTYVDGPVRFPPVVAEGKVYFVSDDGFLYCVSAESGKEIWKFRGGPSDRRIIGNERLISTWPARGAPVLRDGSVYFTASIWPFMGTFIYALNAETGEVEWVNDGTGADYLQQPHNYPAFAGIAPQGCLVATAEKLVIPGGRSVPAVFDRKTGRFEYFHLAKYGKSGGSWSFANDKTFFGHERDDRYIRFNLETGESEGTTKGKQPVLAKEAYYFSGASIAKHPVREPGTSQWSLDVDATGDLIHAGNRLYAAGQSTLTAVQLGEKPVVAWTIKVDGAVKRLIAANDRLFAVTLDGRILSFGAETVEKPPVHTEEPSRNSVDKSTKKIVKETLEGINDPSGYAILYDAKDDHWLEGLARDSKFSMIATARDQKTVDALRRRLDAAGLYGSRVAVHLGNAETFDTPPYMSSFTAGIHIKKPETLKRIFRSLRPYGGQVWTVGPHQKYRAMAKEAGLPNFHVGTLGDISVISRRGALAGAGDWTHQYGNIRNTVKSDDKLVKLPLGVLWFGGSSNMDVLPRHGHGPPEQLIGGRLFIQGMDSLSARDVYTGRVLWKAELKNLNTFGTYFDQTYKNLPLTLEYNQVHIPGANARGTNFIATEDQVYIVEGKTIRVLDTRTGETVNTIRLPKPKSGDTPESWGYIGVFEDYLIAGTGFANFSKKLNMPHDESDKRRSKWRFTDYDKSASAGLAVLDRHTGEVLWQVPARHGFLHNTIVAMDGLLYCLDKMPPNIEQKLQRRGQAKPETYRLLAFNVATGEVTWQTSKDVFGSWLSCSEEHNLLLQTTRPSSDTVRSEDGARMIAYAAVGGEIIWDKPIRYSTPPILHGDKIITGGKMYSLTTGDVQYRIDPLTGKRAEWTYVSTKGCNYPIACENLITFRSSAAAFYDLTGDGGTGHFGGFKSGCTSNLIAAGGVLNAPDYTRTCRCSFQNQTSLALVHMPGIEIWTHNDFGYDGERVRQVGINFGAPGDRRAKNGTLWMEYPSVGGPSPNIDVDVAGPANYFRHHSSRIAGEQSWVAASGVSGARTVTLHLSPSPEAPEEIRVAITNKNDDAEEYSNGEVVLGSNDLELTEDSSRQTVGLRFQKIPLPPRARIKAAYIQFQVDEPTRDPSKLEITAEAVGNAAKFASTPDNLSARARTKTTVLWKPVAWKKAGDTGPEQRTPDLAKLIQKLVDRKDWKAGNAIAFLIDGSGSHVAKSYEGSKKGAARLVVEFEKPGKKNPALAIVHKPHTVRLFFTEPATTVKPGDRVFDVALQGERVLEAFDVAAAEAGSQRTIIKEFKAVSIAETLTISLKPHGSQPAVLCGVEVIAEEDKKQSRLK